MRKLGSKSLKQAPRMDDVTAKELRKAAFGLRWNALQRAIGKSFACTAGRLWWCMFLRVTFEAWLQLEGFHLLELRTPILTRTLWSPS